MVWTVTCVRVCLCLFLNDVHVSRIYLCTVYVYIIYLPHSVRLSIGRGHRRPLPSVPRSSKWSKALEGMPSTCIQHPCMYCMYDMYPVTWGTSKRLKKYIFYRQVSNQDSCARSVYYYSVVKGTCVLLIV